MDERIKNILGEIRTLTETAFDGLVGIYIHGSLAFGCFTWERSDIDYLAVLRASPTHEGKRKYIEGLLEINERAPSKGIEMSVVLLRDTLCPKHPIPYELHFSNAHRDAYREDIDGYINKLKGNDPDLSAHFAVTRAVGYALCGETIHDVFGEVRREDYLDSILCDIKNAAADIRNNPVYVTLNLCRAAAYAENGAVLSKADGAKWAKNTLPTQFMPIADAAYKAYVYGEKFDITDGLTDFARYMLGRFNLNLKINKHVKNDTNGVKF